MTPFEQAKQRVEKNMFKIRNNPDLIGIGGLADMVQEYKELKPYMVPAGQVPTLATDGKYVYLGPQFIADLRDSELRFILLHEIYHISFKHQIRMINTKLDPGLANKAKDAIINGILLQSKAFREGFITWPDGGWRDDRFDDGSHTWEMVYKVYEAEQGAQSQPEDEDEDAPAVSTSGDSSESESGDSSPDTQSSDSTEDSNSEAEDETKEEGEEEQEQDGGAGDGAPTEQGTGDIPPQPRGDGAWGAVWAPEDITQEEIDEINEETDRLIAEGEHAERSWGVGSGSQTSLGKVQENNSRTVAWDELRELLRDEYSPEKTWSKPHVVYQQQQYMPSREKQAGTLHGCFDMSASFTMPMIQLSKANLERIAEDLGVRTIKISYVDYDVLRPDGETWQEFEVSSGEEISVDIVGRGGTRFDPIFEAIEEEDEEVTALVYFTDGEGYVDNRNEPEFPVIWATTNIPPITMDGITPFGEVVNIAADLAREELYR